MNACAANRSYRKNMRFFISNLLSGKLNRVQTGANNAFILWLHAILSVDQFIICKPIIPITSRVKVGSLSRMKMEIIDSKACKHL